MSFKKSFVFYFLFPLCIFLLLRPAIEQAMTSYLVIPIFSRIKNESIIVDLSLIGIMFISFYSVIRKTLKGVKIPAKYSSLSLMILTIYLVYRYPLISSPYQLYNSNFCNGELKLLDIPFIIPILILMFYVNQEYDSFFKQSKIEENNENTFQSDHPISLNEKNDTQGRLPLIQSIIEKIKLTKNPYGSFAIGIVGKWGVGKTVFISKLREVLDEDKNNITLEINAWRGNVIENFLESLGSSLKRESFAISNILTDYMHKVLEGNDNSMIVSVKNVLSILSPIKSIEEQFNLIKNEISKIDKKIIVFIDDLDRLDKQEIYNVIKLIRNTGNFPNTFFVAAYDKGYILNAIEELNPYQANYFLEKIFQVEIPIPSIQIESLETELKTHLTRILLPIHMDYYNKMKDSEVHSFYDQHQFKDELTPKFIKTYRDVIRFVIAFELDYKLVLNDICFSDLYYLELLKLKFPTVYTDFHQNYLRFLTLDEYDQNGVWKGFSNFFSLSYDRDNILNNSERNAKSSNSNSSFKTYLLHKKKDYKLEEDDITLIEQCLSEIFRGQQRYFSSPKEKSLSVVNQAKINRYFLFNLQMQLGEEDFQKIIELPLNQLKDKIDELISTPVRMSEFIEKLNNLHSFKTAGEFEKIVLSIFHLANIQPNKDKNKVLGYSTTNLTKLLVDNARLYPSVDDYKEFLKSILISSYNDLSDMPFKMLYLKYLLHFGSTDFNFEDVKKLFSILEASEIEKLQVSNLEILLNKSKKFNIDIWFNYSNCETLIGDTNNIFTPDYSISYKRSKEARYILRKFICKNDIDGFIEHSIELNHSSDKEKYILNSLIPELFKSFDLFIDLLNRKFITLSTIQTEFIDFYKELNIQNSRDGIYKDFKAIKLKWGA